jgi:hypothetical protein
MVFVRLAEIHKIGGGWTGTHQKSRLGPILFLNMVVLNEKTGFGTEREKARNNVMRNTNPKGGG